MVVTFLSILLIDAKFCEIEVWFFGSIGLSVNKATLQGILHPFGQKKGKKKEKKQMEGGK